MPIEIDYARLAAYIDGEGCISAKETGPNNSRMFICINVYQTDPRLIAWIVRTFQIGKMHQDKQPRKRSYRCGYYWQVYGSNAASILKECLPFFIVKKEQAEMALAIQETMGPKGLSNKPVSQEVREIRAKLKSALHVAKTKEWEQSYVS